MPRRDVRPQGVCESTQQGVLSWKTAEHFKSLAPLRVSTAHSHSAQRSWRTRELRRRSGRRSGLREQGQKTLTSCRVEWLWVLFSSHFWCLSCCCMYSVWVSVCVLSDQLAKMIDLACHQCSCSLAVHAVTYPCTPSSGQTQHTHRKQHWFNNEAQRALPYQQDQFYITRHVYIRSEPMKPTCAWSC